MESITAKDLANRTGAVLERIRRGERLRITYRGKIIADLVPTSASELSREAELRRRKAASELRGCLREAEGLSTADFIANKEDEKELEKQR